MTPNPNCPSNIRKGRDGREQKPKQAKLSYRRDGEKGNAMTYQSYKHYVLSGHSDSVESWIEYRVAQAEESATETGVALPTKTKKLLANLAARAFHLRYTLPTECRKEFLDMNTVKLDAALEAAEEQGAEIYCAFYSETDAPPAFWLIVYLGGMGDDEIDPERVPELDAIMDEGDNATAPPLVTVEYLHTHYRVYIPQTWETHYLNFPKWENPRLFL